MNDIKENIAEKSKQQLLENLSRIPTRCFESMTLNFDELFPIENPNPLSITINFSYSELDKIKTGFMFPPYNYNEYWKWEE